MFACLTERIPPFAVGLPDAANQHLGLEAARSGNAEFQSGKSQWEYFRLHT
jgi:hypothetical protein